MDPRIMIQEVVDGIKVKVRWHYGLMLADLQPEVGRELLKRTGTSVLQVLTTLLFIVASLCAQVIINLLRSWKYIATPSPEPKSPRTFVSMFIYGWLAVTYWYMLRKLISMERRLRACPCRNYPICRDALICICFGLHIFPLFAFDSFRSACNHNFFLLQSTSNVLPNVESMELLKLFRFTAFCYYIHCHVGFLNFDFMHFIKQHFDQTPDLAFYMTLCNCASHCVLLVIVLPQNLLFPTLWFHFMHYLERVM